MAKKSIRRQSRRKMTRRTSKKTQRGGNYHLNVGAERIGGMAEVVNVNDPIAPIQGASSGQFATPLFMMQGGAKKRKSKRRSSKKRRVQKGGMAALEVAYDGNGMQSVFHDNMMQRDFTCATPNWKPECI
jgi:hypothetical protein